MARYGSVALRLSGPRPLLCLGLPVPPVRRAPPVSLDTPLSGGFLKHERPRAVLLELPCVPIDSSPCGWEHEIDPISRTVEVVRGAESEVEIPEEPGMVPKTGIP